MLVPLVCQYTLCGQSFSVIPSRLTLSPRFCSMPCRDKHHQSPAHFWERVAHCAHEWICPYCCWPWQKAISTDGYGKVTYKRQTLPAHRRAWELWHARPLPTGYELLHDCPLRACCNPMHLVVATPSMIAAHAKARGVLPQGSTHGMSLLCEEDIPTIFALHHTGLTAPAIAKGYGVTPSTILAVLHRQTWAHVALDDALTQLRPKPVPLHAQGVEAQRAYWRAWYWAHHEECLLASARYKAAHGDEIRAQQRTHKKEVYQQNPIPFNERHQAYYANNTEKVRQQNAEYQRTHPEKVQAFGQRRRARQQSVRNDFTAAQWEEMLAIFKHCCAYCGKKSKQLEIEHITPISLGGENTASNIVPSCRTCNAKKRAKPAPIMIQPLLLTLAPAKENRTRKK